MSTSFIFLAIMDTLPHRQPPAEFSAQAHATTGWISARTRVHLAESDYKSNSKLCSCILKSAQTMHDVLLIQTLCNSAHHSKTVGIVKQLKTNDFSQGFTSASPCCRQTVLEESPLLYLDKLAADVPPQLQCVVTFPDISRFFA